MKKDIKTTEKTTKNNAHHTAKKAAGTAAAITVAAGVIVNGAVGSPSDLIAPQAAAPVSICEIDGQTEDGAEDDNDSSEENEETAKSGLSLRKKIAEWLMGLPLGVRVFIALPLWGIGCIVNGALSALWTNILSPSMGSILRWLSFAAIALIAVIAVIRALLPDMPVKHILCKRNLRIILIGALVLGIGCAVSPLFIEDFSRYEKLIETAGWLIITGSVIICCYFDDRHAHIIKPGEIFS